MDTAHKTTDADPAIELPVRLSGFADRLVFIRLFVARYKSAKEMADRLQFPPSTYATWENGSAPHDKAVVVARVEAHFGRKVSDWLLRGGETFTFTYRGGSVTSLRDVLLTPRLPFKLPPAKTDTTLSVA